MSSSIIIPKRKARKHQRTAGGSDFWDGFWQQFDSAQEYTIRVSKIGSELTPIVEEYEQTQKDIYVEVQLDERATTKSNRPTELWEQSNLDVVEAREDNTLTLSGKSEDFKKLLTTLNSAEFETARTGEGISRSNKNLYRQLFAVSELSDKNTDIHSRVDQHLNKLIEDNHQGNIKCLIEIYSNQPSSKYDELFTLFTSKFHGINISKRDTEVFLHNMSYSAELTVDEIKNILSSRDFSFVWLIKLYPSLSLSRLVPHIDLSNLTVSSPLTNEIVGIFDSGVSSPLLDSIRFNREKFIASHLEEDKNHGTFVTSRVTYGDDLFSQTGNGNTSVHPVAKFLDIQVSHKSPDGTDVSLDTLLKAIKEVLNRYRDIKIFNLSINEKQGIQENLVSDLTEFIDEYSRRYDVLFICSVGNQEVYSMESDYQRIFSVNSYESKIAAPSDGLNVLSVGSIVDKADNTSICEQNFYPSPFTRKGGIRKDWKKPELVAVGGNKQKSPSNNFNDSSYILASNNQFGVEGINTGGLVKEVGTSFSTPLITRQSVLLLDYIKKSNLHNLLNLDGNYANLVKALMIHSTATTDQIVPTEEPLKKALGFGQANYKSLITEDEDKISIIYSDIIDFNEKIHKINFELPADLVGQPAEFIFTMVYNPPVNKNFPSEYSMIKLDGSVRALTPTIDPETGKTEAKINYICSSPWNWEKYKNDSFNVIHWKCSKKKITTPYLEVLAQMLVSEKYEQQKIGHEEDIYQPYTFVLTIINKSLNNRLKSEVLATNQFNVLIENAVEVQSSI